MPIWGIGRSPVPLLLWAAARYIRLMLRLVPLVLLLTACDRGDRTPDSGGVTVNEEKALDDAAAMLAERDAQADNSSAKAEN